MKTQIERSERIALIAHENPDTDALASLVSLKKIIERNFDNKVVDIFAQTDKLDEINKPLLKEDTLNARRAEIYDLAISLDTPNLKRLGIYEEIFTSAKDSAQIDHHNTNEKFANNNLVYFTSSTTEIIYLIAKIMKLEISDGICKAIYAGMITDTANFTQGAKRKTTISVINDFYNRKLELDKIAEYYFKNNSISKNKLLEKAIHSMKFYFDGGLAIMKLNKQDFLDVGAKAGDEEGIVNQGINTKGVNIACIFIKRDNNLYYISMRGKGGANVASIAQKFGGGGHETMAAFTYQGNLMDIKSNFFKECYSELKGCKERVNDENLFFDDVDENITSK